MMEHTRFSEKPAGKKVVVGFDGYIDELYRVVEKGDNEKGYAFYPDIASFAARIADAAGKSADIELVPTDRKLGGNAPIMANALSCLGVDTTCLGAMGYPALDSVFADMTAKTDCVSVCDPALTYAFEFNDGKLMFGNTRPLDGMNWSRLTTIAGLGKITETLAAADLIALVNWSGFAGADDIWRGIYRDVLPAVKKAGRAPKFFFDLADPTKKSADDMAAVLDLIHDYAAYGETYLGLNENEAVKLAAALGIPETALPDITAALYRRTGITAVVVHPIDRSIAASADGVCTERGKLVEKPRITTGGGDNFNAGFCLGLLLGYALPDALKLAMRVSGLYVANGGSPSFDEAVTASH